MSVTMQGRASITSRSILRHRPIEPEVKEFVVFRTPRASRTKTQEIPFKKVEAQVVGRKTRQIPPLTQSYAGIKSVKTQALPVRPASHLWLVTIALSMIMTILLLWAGQNCWQMGNTLLDDLRYGRPRTIHSDHFVGHEIGNIPSHFVAMNVGGQISVLEMPGGNPAVSHLLMGPHLTGPGADLKPVTLAFVGNKADPDLLIEVNGVSFHFHNTGKTFEPAP